VVLLDIGRFRAGSRAYLAGSIASLGSQYVLGLKAVNCQSGDPLAEAQVRAASKEKVLDALGEAALSCAASWANRWPRADVRRSARTGHHVFARSSEGVQPWQKGRNEKGSAAALPYDQRAIELDPNFATGYRALGGDYFSLGELGRASEYFAKSSS
jgi:hypothetical protein